MLRNPPLEDCIVRSEILDGVENGEFAVLYQPQMTADGARMAAVEALVRWRHPARGFLGPGNFIEIAESNGAIRELGAFVLRQACLDARRWPGLVVSVNVSTVQLRDPGFADFVEAALRESELEPTRLELEIVETALIDDFDVVARVIRRLRAIGVRSALDDFGTGYSSLTYLRKIPLDKLKIDKSFVDEIGTVQAAAILHAVVAMSRALGLKVTAEGVETEDQARFLRVCGCHYLQGYLFAKPIPAEEITLRLASMQTERRASPLGSLARA